MGPRALFPGHAQPSPAPAPAPWADAAQGPASGHALQQSLFGAQTKGFHGWTLRDPAVLPARVARDGTLLQRFRMAVRNGAAVGYTYTTPYFGTMVDEVVAPPASDFQATVRALESRVRSGIASAMVSACDADRGRLANLGYDFHGPHPPTTMARVLDEGHRDRDLTRLFGVDQGTFIHYATDWF